MVLGMISNQLKVCCSMPSKSNKCRTNENGDFRASSQAFQAASPCPRRNTPTVRIKAYTQTPTAVSSRIM